MDNARILCASLLSKIHEQIDGSQHLISLLPADCADWRPETLSNWTVGILLGHLLDCMAGFCAVLYAFEPQDLADFVNLQELPVNHRCLPHEAANRIETYRRHIDEGFALLTDADLGRLVPTVFVKQGESLLTLLLGNLEHLINHKHQLFTCLKLLGIEATSRDLYRFRE
jgi:hypothetical protein